VNRADSQDLKAMASKREREIRETMFFCTQKRRRHHLLFHFLQRFFYILHNTQIELPDWAMPDDDEGVRARQEYPLKFWQVINNINGTLHNFMEIISFPERSERKKNSFLCFIVSRLVKVLLLERRTKIASRFRFN